MLAMSCSIQWPLKLPAQADQSPKGELPGRETTHGADRGKEAIRVAPIARRRTSILALTATLGLVVIVTGGTLGYRWTYPHMADEVTEPAKQDRLPPPTASPRSLSNSARPLGATCGADRITTQRGRCDRHVYAGCNKSIQHCLVRRPSSPFRLKGLKGLKGVPFQHVLIVGRRVTPRKSVLSHRKRMLPPSAEPAALILARRVTAHE